MSSFDSDNEPGDDEEDDDDDESTPFRNLCAIHGPPSSICSFASSIASLFVHEKALLISVSEFR